jgi:hypothetical protein
MREKIGLLLAMLMVFSLAACSSSASATPQASNSGLTASAQGPLSEQTQLIIGTFKLEGTDLAVSSEQASTLLPLYKALLSLSQSDTAATAEIEAVAKQIQESMSAEQMDAIAAMKLTQQDAFTIVQEFGFSPDATQSSGSSGGGRFSGGFSGGDFRPPDEGQGGTFQRGGQGDMPQGGVIVGPGGYGQEMDPEQLATLEARRAERSGSGDRMMNMFLINPLIKLLEGKIQS